MSIEAREKHRRHDHVVPRSIPHAMEGTKKKQEQEHPGTEVSIVSSHAQKLPLRVVKSADAKVYP